MKYYILSQTYMTNQQCSIDLLLLLLKFISNSNKTAEILIVDFKERQVLFNFYLNA